MLDSWTTSGSANGESKEPEHRKPPANRGIFGQPGNQNSDAKQMYKDYGWLFGKVR